MEIEEIQTWQWMLAGLIAGLLFSCVVSWSGPGFDTQDRETIEQGEFENSTFALTKYGAPTAIYPRSGYEINQYHKDQPFLSDVTVHPPIASDPKHYWVTGRFYFIGRKLVDPSKLNGPEKVYEEWKPFKYPTSIPYEPGYAIKEEKKIGGTPRNPELANLKKALSDKMSFPTVVEYLNGISALPDSNFKFRFAWWELPKFIWTMPPLAGFLMIGVAWPLALSVLRSFGLAKTPTVKAKPAPIMKPERMPTTAMPAGVVLKATAPAAPPPPSEHKEYGGEFYPVVKTTHKD
jgi:hypothetical protein